MRKNLISSYVSKLILLILNFIYISLFIKFLGVEDYGLFTVSLSIVNLFLFFNTGIGLSVIKYLNDKNFESQKVYETLISFSLFIILIFSILQYVFSSYLIDNNINQLKTIYFIIIIFILMFIFTIMSSLLHAKEHIHEVNIIEIVFNISKLILCSIFIILFNLDGAYIGMILSLIISIIYFIYYLKKFIDIKLKRFLIFDINLLKEMVKFIWYNSLNEGIWRLFSNVDKILISKLFGNEILGFYNIAYTLVIRLWDFPDAISRVVYPRFAKIKENIYELNMIYKKVSLLNIIISLIVNILVFIFAFDLISFWLDENVAMNSYWMLQILILGNILGADNWISTRILLVWNDVYIMFKNNVISLLIYIISSLILYFVFRDVKAFLISFVLYYFFYACFNRIFIITKINKMMKD